MTMEWERASRLACSSFRLITSHRLEPFDFEGSLGPSIGLSLLLAGFATYSKRNRFHLMCWSLIIGWSILWAIQVQQIRFFMPIVPLILAFGFSYISDNVRTNRLIITLIAVLSLSWGIKFYKVYWDRQQTGAYLKGDLSDDDFLYRQLPENHPHMALSKWMSQKYGLCGWSYVYHVAIQARQYTRCLSIWRPWKKQSAKDFRKALLADDVSHIAINHNFSRGQNAGSMQMASNDRAEHKP